MNLYIDNPIHILLQKFFGLDLKYDHTAMPNDFCW